MTAPGEAIAFGESQSFKKQVADSSGLLEAVKEEIKNRPNWAQAGVDIGEGIRSLEMIFNTERIAVLFKPETQSCGLLSMFELPRRSKELEDAKAFYKKLFQADRSRRRHA